MKSKLVHTLYRIFTILTFIVGSIMMHFLIRLVIHNLDKLEVTDAKVALALSGLGYSYFAFMLMLLIGIILSLVCFRAAKAISSITRTFATVLAVASCIPAMSIMLECIGVHDYYYGETEKLDITGEFVLTADTYQVFLPMPAFAIITILLVTSIIALVTGPRLEGEDEEQTDEEENEEEQQDGKKKKKSKNKKKDKNAKTERKRMTDNPPQEAPPAEEQNDKKKSKK